MFILKKYLFVINFLFFLCLSFTSCDNYSKQISESENKLLKENRKLKLEIKKLKNEAIKNEEYFLLSQILIGIPDRNIMKVGEKNQIKMLFQPFDKHFPTYNVYKIENNTRIKIGSYNKTTFNYEFIPKSKNDTTIFLIAEMTYNNKIIKIPTIMNLVIK